MSTAVATPASTSLVATITTDTLQYAPAVIAGVQAAEQAAQQSAQAGVPISGAQKFNAVLQGVAAGSADLAQGTAKVAAISGLINLFVSIFNSLGLFTHAPKTTGVTLQ